LNVMLTLVMTFIGLTSITFTIGRVMPADPVLAVIGDRAPQDAYERVYKEMGAWLHKYGQSVYGTRGGPWKPSKNIASTRGGNVIYLHVLRWSGDSITLHGLARKIKGSSLLTGGKVEVKQTEQSVVITVPTSDHQAVDTIVKLDLDGSAMDIPAVTLNP